VKATRLAREGLRALSENPLRTLFMMAGTVLGIASLTVVMAMNDGARTSLEQRLEGFGYDMIRIRAGGMKRSGTGRRDTTLKIADARAIAVQVDGLGLISPMYHSGEAVTKYKNANTSTRAVGVTQDIFEMREMEIARGRAFDAQEQDQMRRVAVLGQTVVDALFSGEDPVGRNIQVNRVSLRVIGILERRGMTGHGHDRDDLILLPLSTAMHRVDRVDYVNGINIQTEDLDRIDEQAAEVEAILRERHHIDESEEDDFVVFTAGDIMEFRMDMVNQFSILLGALALLCLAVGGAVLMNIMLVSVGSRTREIGLRRALGASSRDIFLQLLVESVVVNIMGMLIGTGLGYAVSWIVEALVEDMPTVFSWTGLGMALGFSLIVGVGFGTLPARRAAALQPVEALR